MPEKDPLSYALLTYGWVIALSIWAALASYAQKIKQGKCRLSIFGLVGEMCISGFVGILTFFFCESLNLSPVLSAGIIGISAHMGSRSIYMLESIGESMLKKWANR